MHFSTRYLQRQFRRHPVARLFNQAQRSWNLILPAKHIKIDDEKQFSVVDDYPLAGRRPLRVARLTKMLLLSLLVLLALIIIIPYIIYKPPATLINFFQWKYPDVLFQVTLPSSQHVVALTLDDAPSDETAKLLEILKKYSAKATFFIIGSQIASQPGLLQRIHDEGHELGNHAWEDEPSISLPFAELERQVKEVEALVPANNNGAKYFRPGSGFFNKQLVQKVKKLGYQVVLGGIYPHDPQIHNPKVNARHVLSMVRPGGVIIMHDRRSYSAEQLELVLKGLAERDWVVKSVGGLLKIQEELASNRKSR
ncbi:carbohydrate esterase family 4 protein [Calycina marina]|uniref:chitin deacetylase n=1 Tax=Calycina marina TaxID=1763456 RepID=A0A9P7YZN1_9HELO|nr:carbohydrate esterase family 4 protein [Calycina marina]